MTNEIIVKTQEELDTIPLDYDGRIYIEFGICDEPAVVKNRYLYGVVVRDNRFINAYGNSRVEAYNDSRVVAFDDSRVEAYGDSCVVAFDDSRVEAWGNSRVIAWNNSSVEARCNSEVTAHDDSSVEAKENSTVRLGDNSSVVAWNNSSVIAYGNSTVRLGGDSFVKAWNNSHVIAYGNSHVEAHDYSSVEAYDGSVEAWDNSSVIARNVSHVIAWNNSSVEAWNNSSVIARGNSSVIVRDNSSVTAWGRSHVMAGGSSHVMAGGSSHVMAGGSSQIVDILLNGQIETSGNARIVCMPKTIQEYCEFYELNHNKNTGKFYKSVHKQGNTYYSDNDETFEYVIGEKAIPDSFDESPDEECGHGIHVAPLVYALDFGKNWDDLAIIEVEAKLEDVVVPKSTSGKVRCREVTVLREVPLEECGLYGKILAKRRKENGYKG